MKKKIWEMKFYFIPAIAIAIVMLILPLYIFKHYPKSAIMYFYLGLMGFLIFLRTKDDWNDFVKTDERFDKFITILIWCFSGPVIFVLCLMAYVIIMLTYGLATYIIGYPLSITVAALLGVRIRTIGEAPKGQYIFVSNHCSWLDDILNFIIMGIRKWKVVFAPEVKRVIGAQFFLKRIGVPLNRTEKSSRFSATRKMLEWLKKGFSFRIYPEGRRLPVDKKNEYLCEFDGGAFLASKLSGVKIVPVVISWTFLFKPRSGQWWYSPRTITFIYLDPMEILPGEEVDEFKTRVRDVILETLKNHVQTELE